MTAFVSSFFLSCSSHSSLSSFTSRIDDVDTLIRQGDTANAMKDLKALEKSAFSVYERIAVFKRYKALGEKSIAEKYILSSIKKLPASKELGAVYTHYLLKENRLTEALSQSQKLIESEYESLYAETVLRLSVEYPTSLTYEIIFNGKKPKRKEIKHSHVLSDQETSALLRNEKYVPVYEMAYKATHTPNKAASLWLMNAAVLHMGLGQYGEAVVLKPKYSCSAEEALFWGKVLYDAGYYDMAADSLLEGDKFESDDSLKVEIAALASDALFILGEEESSQKMREKVLSVQKQGELETNEIASQMIPVIGVNSVLYALSHNEALYGYDILSRLVTDYPDFEPALAAYGAMAVKEFHRPPEDEISSAIRSAGLKTLVMEKEEAEPHVTLEDAISKVSLAVEKEKTPLLVVLEEKLCAEKEAAFDKQKRASRVWSLLEKNSIGANKYPPEVVHYAVATLIQGGYILEAEGLFEGYLQGTYNRGDEKFVAAENPDSLSLWECETAAWFAGKNGKAADCERLYSYITDTYASRTPVHAGLGENNVLVHAYTNLGVLYEGAGDEEEALFMLNKASGRATDSVTKAELLYRMASLSDTMGDSRSAVRSLQYALSLNPDHHKARVLLKKLQSVQQ